jgi:hypothetical protein
MFNLQRFKKPIRSFLINNSSVIMMKIIDSISQGERHSRATRIKTQEIRNSIVIWRVHTIKILNKDKRRAERTKDHNRPKNRQERERNLKIKSSLQEGYFLLKIQFGREPRPIWITSSGRGGLNKNKRSFKLSFQMVLKLLIPLKSGCLGDLFK